MTINEIKNELKKLQTLKFALPDGGFVPAHFHITEVGKVTKDFIDCGGKRRTEEEACFQLWQEEADDHRLAPEKLIKIIESSQEQIGLGNLPITVEYQGANTISKFGLEFNGEHFLLTSKKTACLADDQCGIPAEKKMIDLTELTTSNACTPGSGCC